MKYLLVFLLALGLNGCGIGENKDDNGNVSKDGSGKMGKPGIQVLTINGCQYVVYLTGNSSVSSCAIVHAGNCNNPIHQKQ